MFGLVLLTFHNLFKKKSFKMKGKAMMKKKIPDSILLHIFMLVLSTIILEEMDIYSVHVVKLMLSTNYLGLAFLHVHLVFIWKCP